MVRIGHVFDDQIMKSLKYSYEILELLIDDKFGLFKEYIKFLSQHGKSHNKYENETFKGQ